MRFRCFLAATVIQRFVFDVRNEKGERTFKHFFSYYACKPFGLKTHPGCEQSVCVCERETETERDRERERQRKRERRMCVGLSASRHIGL